MDWLTGDALKTALALGLELRKGDFVKVKAFERDGLYKELVCRVHTPQHSRLDLAAFLSIEHPTVKPAHAFGWWVPRSSLIAWRRDPDGI